MVFSPKCYCGYCSNGFRGQRCAAVQRGKSPELH